VPSSSCRTISIVYFIVLSHCFNTFTSHFVPVFTKPAPDDPTRDFGTGTRGFAASEDMNVAVCVLPGTELSFEDDVRCESLWPWSKKKVGHKTAIFRQVKLDKPAAHHDALEFPDGRIVQLTFLKERQRATVLQLPAAGVKVPQRVAYV
jgi:hypothetical protein